jgi:hypothetical protein
MDFLVRSDPQQQQAKLMMQLMIHLASVIAAATDFTMGIQSQLREGAIAKKEKKIGSKAKAKEVHKQNATGGCGISLAEALQNSVSQWSWKKVNIPHRSHHKKCSMNRKTRGLSATTMFVHEEAAPNIAINTASVSWTLGQRLATEAAEGVEKQ